jgi:hypothetical protein
MSEDTTPSWAEQVKKVVSDRAFSLNYEVGMQCRFMPIKSDQGSHTIEILMETTHLGHPFDLQWFVRHGEDPAEGIGFELVAPPAEGGTLWSDRYDSLERLRTDAEILPAFIRGYFVGRSAALSAAAASSSQAR